MTTTVNDNLVLISGESGTGKSASLMEIEDQEGVMYLNCEAGKKLPFRNNFANYTITDPYNVHGAFQRLKEKGNVMKHPQLGKEVKIHTVVIDTVTFLMEMFESMYVNGSPNTQAAWGQYFQFFKELMQVHVASADVNVIILGHNLAVFNEERGLYEHRVPVKGALKNNGIEAYFSTVVVTKKVPLRVLEKYKNDLLTITPDDELVGYKHVFQTRLTKDSVGERIRSPLKMFSEQETYINNDAAALIKHLNTYYNGNTN